MQTPAGLPLNGWSVKASTIYVFIFIRRNFFSMRRFFTMTANGLRLCVRAGFLALHLIRRTELKYTQNASNEARNPA
jgi:hypothetical protein